MSTEKQDNGKWQMPVTGTATGTGTGTRAEAETGSVSRTGDRDWDWDRDRNWDGVSFLAMPAVLDVRWLFYLARPLA